MFKIVQTTEEGKKELTIIPAGWEKNGCLFWPKSRADKLIKQENSLPEDTWFKLTCKLKRNHLVDLEVAEEELNRMLEEDDTEQEEQDPCIPSVSLPRKRPRAILPSRTIDLNDMAQSCVINDVNVSESINTDQAPIIIYQHEISDDISQVEVIQPQTEVPGDFTKIMSTLSTLLENQNKVMHQMAKFETMFDAAMIKSNQHKKCKCSEQQVLVSGIEPIENIEDLEILEQKLKDKQVFQDYIEKMSFLCGKTGKAKGIDVSYMLIDKFFDRKLMLLCSWAGGARDNKEKLTFKFYKNIIRLFFELVHLADNDFTFSECEAFFENIIRNAVKRNASQNARASKSKKRPSNLVYYKKNDTQDENEEVIINAEVIVVHEEVEK